MGEKWNRQCHVSSGLDKPWIARGVGGGGGTSKMLVIPDLLTPVLVCLLLLLLLLLTPVVVCGSGASGMQCLLNIPKMPMVNFEMTKHFAPSCKGS